MARSEEILNDCLSLLVRPVARFCLRHGIGIQRVVGALKQALVKLAEDELHQADAKPSVSRISIMTGIHRKEVRSLMQEHQPDSKSSLLTRVIGQWLEDPKYQDQKRGPRPLNCTGEDSEFHSLVFQVSKDVNPYTVLAELERAGIVERENENVSLKEKMYIPRSDYHEGFRMLASDTENITRAVEENIFGSESVPHLHLRTEYDNIAVERIPEIKTWLLREGSVFQKRLREYLASHDKDINRELKDLKGGGKVAATAFSFVCEPQDKAETK
ncbi:MAG: hypothetical protein KDD66_04205 [Bdellovibrionales bacterium]|nr:hypothetical protein [Bdellovibrionales bacterium]